MFQKPLLDDGDSLKSDRPARIRGWTTITALRKNIAFAKQLSMRHSLELSRQVTRRRRFRILTMMLPAEF
jgi:hypothetical protein